MQLLSMYLLWKVFIFYFFFLLSFAIINLQDYSVCDSQYQKKKKKKSEVLSKAVSSSVAWEDGELGTLKTGRGQ